ncbi:hypothetical protein [Micromonospora sp. NPDC005087]|uniref:hypothetical protein n=1 Tax=Micromonospora sp. NPDC005087 TaxID=3364225 RepID=UPI0036AE7B74
MRSRSATARVVELGKQGVSLPLVLSGLLGAARRRQRGGQVVQRQGELAIVPELPVNRRRAQVEDYRLVRLPKLPVCLTGAIASRLGSPSWR